MKSSVSTSIGVNINKAEGDIHIHSAPQEKVKPQLSFEPKTIAVPAGKFIMGAHPGDAIPDHETPEHSVYLPEFSIGRYPVTNREYHAFIKATKNQNIPAHWRLRQPPANQLGHPVTGVSWEDAQAYCHWLSEQTERNYHLPSEAEWEKSARASDGKIYPWGNKWKNDLCNVSGEGTTQVDAFQSGASEYGCEDLLGNVQEWTLTSWGADAQMSSYSYPYQPNDGREDPPNGRGFYIHRGGYWKSQADELRCSARGYAAADSRVSWRGFRVLLE